MAGKRRAAAKRQSRKMFADARAIRAVTQAVGGVPPRVFGSRVAPRRQRRRRNGNGNGNGKMKGYNLLACLDAFHSSHLPLPRAIGSYTVCRTTQVVSPLRDGEGAEVIFIGPFRNYLSTTGPENVEWSNLCAAWNSGAPTTTINAALGTIFKTIDCMTLGSGTADGWASAQVCPSAVSVQIMNPEALQTSSGIVYAGRCRQVLNLNQDSRQWQQVANELINFSNPRLLSAGKLALRGVQCDAVPYNMNVLSNFTRIQRQGYATSVTWDATAPFFSGFAPIFIYNPERINLQLLVCIEWRVRFDPANPAYATHIHHPPASDAMWGNITKAMESCGNGVVDIVEKVARVAEGAAAGAGAVAATAAIL